MFAERSTWPVARPMIVTALSLFVITIVIGILNGLDVYDPGHDVLITHVHAGTLGWITLMVGAMALLAFGHGSDTAKARTLGRLLTGAIALYVAAFWLGDLVFSDRIQRPIAGTLLLIMVVSFLAWIMGHRTTGGPMTVPKLGLLLSWVSLLIGAVFGIILGLYIARGSVPFLPDDVALGMAEAHPPAMIIGFVILAGLAIAEWAIRGERTLAEDRSGRVQMWLLFTSGMLVNIALITGAEDILFGPANLLQIVAIGIFVKRLWPQLRPSGWKGVGAAVYPRMGAVMLVANIFVLTYFVSRILSGATDLDNLTDADMGLITGFDHVFFIGLMTNVLFGVILSATAGNRITTVDTLVLWGINIGLIGFFVGLVTVEAVPKQIFTPIMGTALLTGIAVHMRRLMAPAAPPPPSRSF